MKSIAALLVFLAAALPVYPWGKEGHQAIALVAEQRLTPETRRHIEAILGNDDLASISVWMDDLRLAAIHQGPLAADPEAQSLIRKFPKNRDWHFVDLPLGESRYSDDDPFSRPDDVVHMINTAIGVLEGQSAVVSKKVALYMIVHFVGDEHQPLHITSGYFDVSAGLAHPQLVTDPLQAEHEPSDRGGNSLYYGPGRQDELHAYWDTNLVEKLARSSDPRILASLLQNKFDPSWKSSGDYHHWAEAWATESLVAAKTAYSGLAYGQAELDAHEGLKKIQIKLPADYDAAAMPIAEERLAKAGYHLSEILNAIRWSM